MFCAECGFELLEGSEFCSQCGARIGAAQVEKSDAELEHLAALGDREAFGILYQRHSDALYDYLSRMLRDREEAQDVMQDAFLQAWRALSPEKKDAPFRNWVFVIAHRLALKRLERRKRFVAPAQREGEDDFPIFDQVDPDRLAQPEAAAEAREMSNLVWEAATGLNPKERSLLLLHVRQGLESAEIAQVLGVSKGNAYTMISRLKDSFESAVASLYMLRYGRRDCPELDYRLREESATVFSPAVRKLIQNHVSECPNCQERRRKLVSPVNILGSFAAVPLPLLVKQRIGEALAASAAQAGAHAAGAGLKDLLTQPAAKLASLPTAWKTAIIAGVVTLTVGGGLGGWMAVSGGLPGASGGEPSRDGIAASTPAAMPAGSAKRIIFTRTDSSQNRSELWAINSDGSGLTLLAEQLQEKWSGILRYGGGDPIVSPLRDKVAFIGSDGNLWLGDTQGGDLHRLSSEAAPADGTFCASEVLIAGWAPDGKRILYYVPSFQEYGDTPTGGCTLQYGVTGFYVVDIESGAKSYLPGLPNFVAWLDAERVIFETEAAPAARPDLREWYTFDIATTESQVLTEVPFFDCLYPNASLSYADHTMVYECSYPDVGSSIIRANIDNTEQQVLLEGDFARLQRPRVSPDGGAFVFARYSGGPHIFVANLYYYDLVSGRQTLLLSGQVMFQEWLDNDHIVVLESQGGEVMGPSTLYVVNVQTGERAALAENIDYR